MLEASFGYELGWAVQTFGEVELGDERRRKRAVQIASVIARNPSASVPCQFDDAHQAKAVYRFFDMPSTTLSALCTPHWLQTLEKASTTSVTLLIQDTTSLNFGDGEGCEGLGPISTNGQNMGLFAHSVLAVRPLEGSDDLEVLGLAHHTVYARTPAPEGEKQSARRSRRCESDRWTEAMDAIGEAPEGKRLVYVADREADLFDLFVKARKLNVGCVIRAGGSASMRGANLGHDDAPEKEAFAKLVRSLPAQGASRKLWIRKGPDREGREAELQVAYSPVTLHAPKLRAKGEPPERLYVVRVFEPSPPATVKSKDVVEWILVVREPITSVEDAWRIVGWYRHRWAIEEYHKCLKTGCVAEERQLEHVSRLTPLIGMLCIVASRLLQLKLLARAAQSPPALEAGPREHVQMMALHRRKDARSWTCRDFWREVAKMGGFMGRRLDGDPGWLTIWRGWLKLDAMVEGALLYRQKSPSGTCG